MRGKYAASKFGFSLIAHYDNKLQRTGSGRSKLLKLLDRVGPFFWLDRSISNKWPKCLCRYQTPSPDNTCANDVTENDIIDSWMNMHTLLASRPNVVASVRVDATCSV